MPRRASAAVVFDEWRRRSADSGFIGAHQDSTAQRRSYPGTATGRSSGAGRGGGALRCRARLRDPAHPAVLDRAVAPLRLPGDQRGPARLRGERHVPDGAGRPNPHRHRALPRAHRARVRAGRSGELRDCRARAVQRAGRPLVPRLARVAARHRAAAGGSVLLRRHRHRARADGVRGSSLAGLCGGPRGGRGGSRRVGGGPLPGSAGTGARFRLRARGGCGGAGRLGSWTQPGPPAPAAALRRRPRACGLRGDRGAADFALQAASPGAQGHRRRARRVPFRPARHGKRGGEPGGAVSQRRRA